MKGLAVKYSAKYYFLRKGETAGNYLRGRKIGKCSVCGEPTQFIEINYQGYFCSTECLDKFERDIQHYDDKDERRHIPGDEALPI